MEQSLDHHAASFHQVEHLTRAAARVLSVHLAFRAPHLRGVPRRQRRGEEVCGVCGVAVVAARVLDLARGRAHAVPHDEHVPLATSHTDCAILPCAGVAQAKTKLTLTALFAVLLGTSLEVGAASTWLVWRSTCPNPSPQTNPNFLPKGGHVHHPAPATATKANQQQSAASRRK